MDTFWGKVKRGERRGKKLGYPTANIALRRHIPEGIYISQTKLKDTWHKSLTFIGQAITFGETSYKAETYLLSFDKNLYDTWISVKLLKKIRKNKMFANAGELIKQMSKDKKEAEKYFKYHRLMAKN